MESQESRNEAICPRCGDVTVRSPTGTTLLPTLGMAQKASRGADFECDCGKRQAKDAEGA